MNQPTLEGRMFGDSTTQLHDGELHKEAKMSFRKPYSIDRLQCLLRLKIEDVTNKAKHTGWKEMFFNGLEVFIFYLDKLQKFR
ncbi:hypothetical protein ABIE66_006041 [Peribacillus sp. B2I2]